MRQDGDWDSSLSVVGKAFAHGEGRQFQRRLWLIKLAPLFALGAASGGVFYLAWSHGFNLQSLAERHRELQTLVREHHAAAFAAYLSAYVVLASLSLPGCVVLSAAGGLLFGWFVGALVAVIGATTGATLFFLLARSSLSESFPRKEDTRICRLRTKFQRDALSYMLFLRLTPAFPFGIVNLTAAFLNVRLRDFVLGTFLGVIPATLIFASAGAGIDHVIAIQRKIQDQCLLDAVGAGTQATAGNTCVFALSPSDFLNGQALSLLAVLGVVALVPPAVKKLRKNIQGDA